MERVTARRIVHLDMDAFYASVELARRPELAGRAIVVGGRSDPRKASAGRGVVTTASYEARKFGVHSGMSIAEAYRRCPDAEYLPTDFAEYGRVSRQFKASLTRVTALIEDRGIDEVYLDVTDLRADDISLAGELKQAVRDSTGLSCSVGIAPNKLLAKIASDLQKPDGLTVIGAADLATRIWPLEPRKIPGIGRAADARLRQLGVKTIGDLAAVPIERLRAVFGASYAVFLHQAAHGIDDRPIVTYREPKTMSRETTFAQDIGDWPTISKRLAELAHRVAQDLRAEGYVGLKVGIKLRYADFKTHTRETSLDVPSAAAAEIRRAAFACLQSLPLDRRIRLLGVRVGELRRVAGSSLV